MGRIKIKISYSNNRCYTVYIDIFGQFIFLHISRSAVNVQKYDASEKEIMMGKIDGAILSTKAKCTKINLHKTIYVCSYCSR